MTIETESTYTPGAGVLTKLRAFAITPYDLGDAWQIAEAQARALVALLPGPADRWPDTITELIPSIRVELVEYIPVPGTAFWGHGHWTIHLRTGDEPDQQRHALLHELKHIIDHPLRADQNLLSAAEWESLADHFADVALAHQPGHSARPGAGLVAARKTHPT